MSLLFSSVNQQRLSSMRNGTGDKGCGRHRRRGAGTAVIRLRLSLSLKMRKLMVLSSSSVRLPIWMVVPAWTAPCTSMVILRRSMA